jgi:hypothetical protein
MEMTIIPTKSTWKKFAARSGSIGKLRAFNVLCDIKYGQKFNTNYLLRITCDF